MTNQNDEPGPGRSTSDAAFSVITKAIAQRNEQAHKNARKLRHEKDRLQILQRRQRDLN